jgi:CBS domain-containing protein
MNTVEDLLAAKGPEVWSVSPQASVGESLKVMAEKDVGALLVIEGEKLVGVFSERDYAREAGRAGSVFEGASVGELMSKRVLYVQPKAKIEECMALMTEKHVRHLPVLRGERIVGIVTIGDVVKEVVSKQRFDIQQLTRYITQGY